ncbi:MAG: Rho termination factor N-terminal domain-containing protein, partial [Candidatus Marinimicrobia bacterium]|nr:Rho termination factor N-terminal domain-containing protein [Candidatus Neomarinimicrobiota bacterium]
MDISDLQSLRVKDLTKMAQDMEVTDFSGLKKQDLILRILETKAQKEGNVYSRGVLEIMPDGYGFLRSPDFNYLPSPDDIYVSPSQIKRFGLRTGHLISGQIRPPKDNERFFALLRVDAVNGIDPDEIKTSPHFTDLTPEFPEEVLV